MTRALITGASGFVGAHLAQHLHEKGIEVWASYRQSRKKFSFPVCWLRADLTHIDETLRLVKESRPHFIFHLAAQTITSQSWKNPEGTFQINVAGSVNLLEAALRFSPKARIILVSTAHVYGATFFQKRHVREDHLANPVTPYAASKLLMEVAAFNFMKSHPLRIVIVRGFNQLGTGQEEHFIFSDFCRQIALIEKRKKAPVLEVGNLALVRDFIHVHDAVKAYDLLAHKGRRGEIYNVGSGRGMRLSEGVKLLAKESRIPFIVRKKSERLRKNDYPYGVADCSKVRKLGWRPRASLTEGLRELLNEWRNKVR